MQARPYVSTALFKKIFKHVCGFKLKQFANNWITSTSCPKLSVSYTYNKKNNSLDLTLTQQSAVKDYLSFFKYTKEGVQTEELLTRPFLRKDPIHLSNEKHILKEKLEAID